MWTMANRAHYKRGQLRYPSDTAQEEWAQLAALIPPARRGGRKLYRGRTAFCFAGRTIGLHHTGAGSFAGPATTKGKKLVNFQTASYFPRVCQLVSIVQSE